MHSKNSSICFTQYSGRSGSDLDCIRQAVLYPFVYETRTISVHPLPENRPRQNSKQQRMADTFDMPESG